MVRRALVSEFAEKLPLLTGLVALAEDPAVRVVTNLVECEPEALRAELPVRVVFRPLVFPNLARRVIAPMFTPDRRAGR